MSAGADAGTLRTLGWHGRGARSAAGLATGFGDVLSKGHREADDRGEEKDNGESKKAGGHVEEPRGRFNGVERDEVFFPNTDDVLPASIAKSDEQEDMDLRPL